MAKLDVDWSIVDKHRQRLDYCVPSAVELVLKQLKIIRPTEYPLQDIWTLDGNGSFTDVIKLVNDMNLGITFETSFEKGREHKIENLIEKINEEIEHGRYVIISLPIKPGNKRTHMHVVYSDSEDGLLAFTKGVPDGKGTFKDPIGSYLAKIFEINGADILTYFRAK